jgi:hypothetical protein
MAFYQTRKVRSSSGRPSERQLDGVDLDQAADGAQ